MTLDPIVLVVGALVIILAWIGGWAAWVRGGTGSDRGGVEPTWYPPLPGQGYQPRARTSGREAPPRGTGARLPINPPKDTGAASTLARHGSLAPALPVEPRPNRRARREAASRRRRAGARG